MSVDPQTEYIDALIDLHRGIERKGPGDNAFSLNILSNLSTLPPHPQIADLGCGSGAGALLLAEYYQSPVMAVDFALGFIDELKIRAKQCELEHLIKPIHGDMAKLDWADGSIDLLWSEGAAYNLGFEQALTIWRSLLTNTGLAVISEMSWFADHVPEPAALYWQNAYPMIANEAENSDRAHRSGFKVISTHRLPSQAWWKNYYEPLREQTRQVEISPVMQLVIDEIEEEMNLFERFSDFYGYTFYVLQVRQ
ncbi:MAG: class I SAM-dependent methyltransferase [Pseudanabaena sp. M135S2SP2A07QC]|jgi:ubiquinone/menaquinone biosynthesis C-methylase UbiE|nr:class I SAM-dependent methyltransferase [Pseudanabaena sp. M090S1SP2A07QC]MCA6507093.1 class I SAM-dependent methyltransferase [Pseudanabaena sp. M172S2SP2A07QC]MCA6521084.1 class I SAM-dependent methyltransferase [Pseudanabaena sp. M051S1SP2A07QC]MCA6530698.1 class I SAM-dependent methyltransferase [Pseudanabaena sp. M125S2SP2A07QC]MCA6536203.1 class I SAM-dependent methyltransferase [Pseudanabaena sp. M176S2SP2A07QC]MCA6541595.1 class I SAM-dependent methyltransferase [Pseudanabaena sp. M